METTTQTVKPSTLGLPFQSSQQRVIEMSDPLKRMDQITQEVDAISDLAESENRGYTDEEVERVVELSREARKIMRKEFENPLAV